MLLPSQIPMGSRSAWAQSNGLGSVGKVAIQLKASWRLGLFVPLDSGTLGNM